MLGRAFSPPVVNKTSSNLTIFILISAERCLEYDAINNYSLRRFYLPFAYHWMENTYHGVLFAPDPSFYIFFWKVVSKVSLLIDKIFLKMFLDLQIYYLKCFISKKKSFWCKNILLHINLQYHRKGRGHWTVSYTGTQSFIKKFGYIKLILIGWFHNIQQPF